MDLGDLFHARLEVFARLILDTPVLDEEREMMLAVFACYPAKIVDITVESVVTGRLELIAKQFLYFGFEDVEAHPVNGVFQACILSADEVQVSEKGKGNNQGYSLCAIAIVSLNQHNLFGNNRAFFNSAETDHIPESGICLLASMCDTHATSNGDIETGQLAFSINNCDETKVIGKDIDIICRWHCDGNFELAN
jgi:hypothetical protein